MLAPFLANVAVKFGPPEMFSLLLIAFILLGSLGRGSFFKTMPMILLGLLVGTIGMEMRKSTIWGLLSGRKAGPNFAAR